MMKKPAAGSRRKNRGRPASGEPNPVDVYVGKRLALVRKIKHLSQQKLADALGITFQQVQKYEKGNNRISCSRLWDFSQVLQVPIEYFFKDMPNDVSYASPRFILGGNKNGWKEEKTSEIYDNQTLNLICDLKRISNQRTVKYLHKLIAELAKSSYEVRKNLSDNF